MRAWTCIDHAGHWPVPVASVIVAESEAEAKALLMRELAFAGLDPDNPPFTLQELPLNIAQATVLSDGEY